MHAQVQLEKRENGWRHRHHIRDVGKVDEIVIGVHR